MFPGPLGHSLAGKALLKKIWSFTTIHIRDFAIDSYGTVDDEPYGGGAGMVLRADVIKKAIESISDRTGPLIYFTPRGQKINQDIIKTLTSYSDVTFLCGRYEGVDERIFLHYPVLELSLGDFILSGGEMAALSLMDACIRLLPDVMGKEESILNESFENGLLEHPLYTKPALWEGLEVPDVLRSGHHGKIDKWKHQQSIEITRKRRPDLWVEYLKHNLSKKNEP